jgi:hypothetical protein
MPIDQTDIDRLLVRLRGLVLVRNILEQRGASKPEIEAHSAEIERVRWRLADLVRASLRPVSL